jgi:protease I
VPGRLESSEQKRIAFLTAAEGVEEVELVEPRKACEDAGHQTVLVSPEAGEVQAFNHLDKAGTHQVDHTLDEVSLGDFDALVLPGGVANPDVLRMNDRAVAFVREFVNSGKPVAAICHAAWTLVEADVVRGRQLTSWPSLQTDIRSAGGEWVDERTVTDGNLITSRNPGDIPAFNSALLEAVAHGAAANPDA